ncbi:MAG: hypothetical protein HYZ91_04365 [Candidatus Omnitrophica bacterium]|nr:hypothetical protein [Candidatus Omnitrophota bacterium]
MSVFGFRDSRDLFREAKMAMKRLSEPNPWMRDAKLWRQLWEVSNFGMGLSLLYDTPIQVRAVAEEANQADGQLQIGFEQVDVQTRVVDHPEREPDRGFREKLDVEWPELSPEEASVLIQQAVRAKENRRYAKERLLYLLLHANFSKGGLDLSQMEASVGVLCPRVFDQIWLLTSIWHAGSSYAIGRLHPAGDQWFFYDSSTHVALDPKHVHFPFGPAEIEAGVPRPRGSFSRRG